MYNGVISGVSLSGDNFFYDNPLEFNGDNMNARNGLAALAAPENITRFMPSIPNYVYATQGE
jgi:DUF1680 family protein